MTTLKEVNITMDGLYYRHNFLANSFSRNIFQNCFDLRKRKHIFFFKYFVFLQISYHILLICCTLNRKIYFTKD